MHYINARFDACWAECCTYVHMFVIYHVQSTVYCPFKYLGYTVFSNPYLSVYL